MSSSSNKQGAPCEKQKHYSREEMCWPVCKQFSPLWQEHHCEFLSNESFIQNPSSSSCPFPQGPTRRVALQSLFFKIIGIQWLHTTRLIQVRVKPRHGTNHTSGKFIILPNYNEIWEKERHSIFIYLSKRQLVIVF